MNQRAAFADTVALAEAMRMPEMPDSPLGLLHLRQMQERIEGGEFSDAKLGRWLGWAQAALVAARVGASLDDMKTINRRHSGEETNE